MERQKRGFYLIKRSVAVQNVGLVSAVLDAVTQASNLPVKLGVGGRFPGPQSFTLQRSVHSFSMNLK
jgi:hypothetical protein